jgi:hypothetical protein
MGGSLIARLRNFSLGYRVAMDAIGSSLWGGFGSPGLVNHFALIGSVVRCDGAMELWSYGAMERSAIRIAHTHSTARLRHN